MQPPSHSAPPAKEILASPLLLVLLTACPSLASHRGILCLDPPWGPGHLRLSNGVGHFNIELMGTCLWIPSPRNVCCSNPAWCAGMRGGGVHNLVVLAFYCVASLNCMLSLCYSPVTPVLSGEASLSAFN